MFTSPLRRCPHKEPQRSRYTRPPQRSRYTRLPSKACFRHPARSSASLSTRLLYHRLQWTLLMPCMQLLEHRRSAGAADHMPIPAATRCIRLPAHHLNAGAANLTTVKRCMQSPKHPTPTTVTRCTPLQKRRQNVGEASRRLVHPLEQFIQLLLQELRRRAGTVTLTVRHCMQLP